MTTFSSQLDTAYKKKVLGTLEKRVKAVAFVVDTILVNTTPVDTGRARANWLPSLNVPSNRSSISVTPESVESVFGSFKLSDTILLTNNLSYIRALNDGTSKQAPEGFVDMAIENGKRAVTNSNGIV